MSRVARQHIVNSDYINYLKYLVSKFGNKLLSYDHILEELSSDLLT